MMDKRLVVVSNRLPYTLRRARGAWREERSGGGLVTALSASPRRRRLWIGWPGGQGEAPARQEGLRDWESRLGCVPVDLSPATTRGFYREYASGALWPALHGFTSRVQVPAGSWPSYVKGNGRFSREVAARLSPADTLWIHDYHLMLLPEMIRERRPEARMGFFLHTPFPSVDAFRVIPHHRTLLRGMLGADALAFQTQGDLANFREAVRVVLGLAPTARRVLVEGRPIRMEAIGAGVDAASLVGMIESQPAIRAAAARLHADLAGRKMILAVDRMDYTKGIPERLRALAAMLRSNPSLHGRVVFVQVAAPTRAGVSGYDRLADHVRELVAEVNQEFGSPGWTPVTLIDESLSRRELASLYMVADVAWVAPLRDGMNLVAKEYVACQTNGTGVLVLSRFAGASERMAEALLVNPYDEEDSAATIVRALHMRREERHLRMVKLLQRVASEDAEWWRERCLGSLDAAVRARVRAVRAAREGRDAQVA